MNCFSGMFMSALLLVWLRLLADDICPYSRVIAICLGLMVMIGCGRPPSTESAGSPSAQAPPMGLPQPILSDPVAPPGTAQPAPEKGVRPVPEEPGSELPERRSLADLLDQDDDGTFQPAFVPGEPAPQAHSRPIPIDDGKVAAAGIRKLTGQHLILYTDVAAQAEVEELPEVFSAAVAQWCQYFGIDPLHVVDWQMIGFLMQEKPRFEGAGLVPADLPQFLNGYQRGQYLWAFEQSDGYYRRHLLLHEGVHGFMSQFLGGIGPPWYAEGTAELLATHRWQDGQIEVARMPQNRTETPGWGRIRIVQEELQAGRGMMPISIMNYGPQAHLQNEPYGWCWAFSAFLDGHPDYRERFRSLHYRIRDTDLTQACRELFYRDWIDLNEQWQIFVVGLDYGYDLERAAVQRQPVAALPLGGATVSIDAARGWQSTGIRLEAGTTYRLAASGRYQVAQTSDIWWCEPGGITIQYHHGRPLGLLVGAIRDESQLLTGLSPLTAPETVGLGRDWTPQSSGTLYLKINESPAHLADNQGELTVRIEALQP